MGLDINGTRFLLYARAMGVDFSRAAMIGRQRLHLSAAELEINLRDFSASFDHETISRIFSLKGYAEEFLKFLGAREVHSLDNSRYEEATHLHDMNRQIPSDLLARYSMVLDGGSLEHIFNFPHAIKNCMEMVEVGGYYLGITPANNFSGHGFYQFSPELFFSVFTEGNGYKVVNVFAFEAGRGVADWFSVKDPAIVQGRVTLTNSEPVYLLVIAKRVRETKIFESTPQQNDYVSAWKKGDNEPPPTIPSRSRTSVATLFNLAPRRLRRAARELLGSKKSIFNPRFFLPIDPIKVAREIQKKL